MANLFFSGFITTDSMKKSNKNSVPVVSIPGNR